MALASTGHPALLKNLTTSTVGDGTRYVAQAYGNRQRPWSAGYGARARAEGAVTLYGVNHPGETSPRVIRIQGAGAANNATPFTYTVDASAIAALTAIGASLPQDTAFTTTLALNAFGLMYALKNQANATLATRIAKSASVPAAVDALTPWFQITGTNTVALAYGGVTSGGLYKDLPLGWEFDLILPDPSTIVTLKTFAAAGEDVVKLTDFVSALNTTAAQTVALNRIFQ